MALKCSLVVAADLAGASSENSDVGYGTLAALAVPDLFRARFNSPALGLTASLLIMFYMSFMMVAQFKSGALVMKIAWPNSGTLALSEDASQFRLSKEKLATLELPSGLREKV